MEDNSYAGQGSVLLDIGGEVGALIVTMPATMEGREVEIRPVGHVGSPAHDHDHHDHKHDHDGHENVPNRQVHLPHVAVIGRPLSGGVAYTLVFPELTEGSYELYERPHGPVMLRATVTGAQVRYADWPPG